MNLIIKPLTAELADDYFDFFENRAFTDDSPYRCYCQVYQMTKAQMQAAVDNVSGEDAGLLSRRIAEQQISNGFLRGYLAYIDNKAIGWCNANDRANYPIDSPYDLPFYAPAGNREKAVVCFEIAPEYRGRGVATALLNRVVDDARCDGYLVVVSFPVVRNERFEWDHHGPLRMYEKAGFVKESEAKQGDNVTMRLLLGNPR